MPDKRLVDIPSSFVEYEATYRDPMFEIWNLRGTLLPAVFRALRAWGTNLENVTWNQNPTNAAEFEARFSLPSVGAVFGVSLDRARLSVANPDWSRSDVISKIVSLGTNAILGVTKVEISKQHLTLAMHLKPREGSIHDITSRYVRLGKACQMAEEARAYGFSVYREDCSWVVDSSSLYTDALFVRISRTFSPTTPFNEIATELNREERELLDLLQLRFK